MTTEAQGRLEVVRRKKLGEGSPARPRSLVRVWRDAPNTPQAAGIRWVVVNSWLASLLSRSFLGPVN